MVDLVIRNVDVLRYEEDRTELLRNHHIAIGGNRIESAGPSVQPEETLARVGESMARLSRRVPESRMQLYNP
ncbi:MAG: hypothetical protein P8127_11485 [Acidobacteriota bacterium]